MSYILDALRRADSERRRSQTPALQQVAQASGWTAAGSVPRRAAPVPWLLALGLALLLAAALAWALFGRKAPVPPAAPAAAPSSVAVTAAPPPVAVTAAPPSGAMAAARQPVAVAPAPPSQPAFAAPPEVKLRPAAPSARPARPVVPTVAPAAEPAPARPAPVADRPLPLHALPEAQRAAIAGLGFGGAVQSQDRTQSFVLQGGQIVREGQTVAPGISVERIEARGLVLRVGEQRVLLPL